MHGRADRGGKRESGDSLEGEARWRREMGIMMEAFDWSADRYWKSTAHEIFAVIEAREEANKR
jgi:hypothetical protein